MKKTATLIPLRRLIAFRMIVILFPVAVLMIAELTLRLVQFGGEIDLVIPKTIAGKEYYAINRSVAWKYFAGSNTIIPEPSEDVFEIQKSAHTKRIFCLGESTMAGFPYDFHATAPGFLRDRLKLLYPHDNIEVINVGLSAVGSFVVEDFLKELLDYEPDLFVIYLGHNEFYGAYGSASQVSTSGSSWLTRLTIYLLRFRLFLAIRDVYTSVLSSGQDKDATLMGQMASQKGIAYGSDLYTKTREVYEENLRAIIALADAKEVPIIFSTLVSNTLTQRPFVPMTSVSISGEARAEWERLVHQGDSLFSEGHLSEAIENYRVAVETDTLNATGFFKLGRALYGNGQYVDARLVLQRGKDLDGLRFRASEDFQKSLLQVCGSLGVPVSRVDSAFADASPHGIPGDNLILEHLHPNVRGYFLMAKTFSETIVNHEYLGPNQSPQPMDEEVWNASTVSEFDSLLGHIKVELLKHKWPFADSASQYKFLPSNELERLVFTYAQGGISWSDARYKAAEYFAGNLEFNKARRECMAVVKVLPFSYQPLLRIADYFRMEKKNDQAKAAYVKCYEVEDNPFARMKLAIILLEEENPFDASKQIESAFITEEQSTHKLPIAASSSARYLLGVAYAKQNNIPLAKRNLELAIAINPNNVDAQQLLRQLPQ